VGHDEAVIELNQLALQQLHCEKQLVVVPRATHLFPEPGALEQVAQLASDWFRQYLANPVPKHEQPTKEVNHVGSIHYLNRLPGRRPE
jgi:hypothetical protein